MLVMNSMCRGKDRKTERRGDDGKDLAAEPKIISTHQHYPWEREKSGGGEGLKGEELVGKETFQLLHQVFNLLQDLDEGNLESVEVVLLYCLFV